MDTSNSGELIEEKVVEKVIVVDTGIREEHLMEIERKTKDEQHRLLQMTDEQKQRAMESKV